MLKTSMASVIMLQTLQSSFVDGHVSLKVEANLRSSSLLSFKISFLTLFFSAVTLFIDGLMCLNLLVGAFATFFRDSGVVGKDCFRCMGDSSVGV